MSAPQKKLRCAVYTRKSTEEGLDQEFNSLDAQHEACAAFVASQAGLGWKLVPERYDDGGISGGTMDRPALQRLLQDIRERKIDVVVVYKIDRLTRSLMDFSRIVEIFDGAGASFVSVTQQFNTTTSMGRLTLNVLLSFAQFEREVTAERIRDKIAASKAKGMWMGGTVPFGYRVENRKLVIDEEAAAEITRLFKRYLELQSVPALARELNGDGDATHLSRLHEHGRQGGRRAPKRVSKGKLYYMLSNPIYIGRIRHGATVYAGEHQSIITEEIFNRVQGRLAEQAPCPRGTSAKSDIHLLTGLLFDETGDRLSPVHANKEGKRYRYYMSRRLKDGRSNNQDGWRIPASEIEPIVLWQLKELLADKPTLSKWMQTAGQAAYIEQAFTKAQEASNLLETAGRFSSNTREIVHMAIRRIGLAGDCIKIGIEKEAVANWLAGANLPSGKAGKFDSDDRRRRTTKTTASLNDASDPDLHIIELPLSLRRRGIGRRLVIEGQGSSLRHPDQPLIGMIAKAHAYLDMLTNGQGFGRKDVAERFGVHPEDVSRLLPLAFLSPRITEAILTGQQPAELSVRHLARHIDLPINWADQAKMLGI
ncbi:hypothetical protein ASD50_12845 [Mesorhizobium sp. Root552]|jgi:DNA invertase Pin-like site-specific DNA recombinase|uniref:recombinase family protein n=1 Tax=Mesorhizobium sp. Root552 TaxID=1736555 RepID=UPI0006F2A983|nr:recombinase family protein [Mesorhizobium sp. Root552]KQZ12254.1 hypothetical protein ASD50_12845 [Mesorhizobium sp. Root552]